MKIEPVQSVAVLSATPAIRLTFLAIPPLINPLLQPREVVDVAWIKRSHHVFILPDCLQNFLHNTLAPRIRRCNAVILSANKL